MQKNWLHYRVLARLKNEIYKNLLTEEHLIPNKIEMKKMTLPDGGEDTEYNFRGWEFHKNNHRYLISDTFNNNKIEIKDILPILPNDTLEVGFRGNVYLHVKNPISLKFKEKKSMSFKELLDNINALNHSNPSQKRLLHMIAFASIFFRTNVRICSNPAFGKDSIIEIYNTLVDRCGTITSPTLAKLEERSTYLRWLGISEVVDIGSTEWKIIQQYLLDAGAHKTAVTKHSRAFGGVQEVIDLSGLSISLLYNDITDYKSTEDYFDFVTKAAVKDRFPAIRFYGQYTEDFNQLCNIDIDKFSKDNLEEFKNIIYNIMYYMKNYSKYIHNYPYTLNCDSREMTNLSNIIKIMDMYSDTEEEFQYYFNLLKSCMTDYKDMLYYPKVLERFILRQKFNKNDTDNIKDIHTFLNYCIELNKKNKSDKLESLIKQVIQIRDSSTFTEKNQLMNNYKEIKEPIKDVIWV